ncbi:MAG: choice-of-anchor V domain-containing protein [Saprospiraceae bacterium]
MTATYKLILGLISGILMISYSNNPPTGTTNAPGEGFCGECHNRINVNLVGNMILDLPPKIEKDSIYDISVSITKVSPTIQRGGFELVALKVDANDPTGFSNAGEFIIESGTSVSVRPEDPIDGRQYLAHAPALNFNLDTILTYHAKWKASFINSPEDQVTFYAAGMLANGNDANTGDLPMLRSSNAIVLPVKITQLACKTLGSSQLISWQMEGLEETKSIFLESSKDGSQWSVYKEIDFSVFQKNFESQLPKFTTAKFYRLRTVSYENDVFYSDISICDTKGTLFYPSVFSDRIYSDVDLSDLLITAHTSDGQLIPVTKSENSVQFETNYKGVIIVNYGGTFSRFIRI